MDAVENMVAQGKGVLCVGNGRMVAYGPVETHGTPGMAFIDRRAIQGQEAVRMIREAIACLKDDARKAKTPKPKKGDEIIVPVEE